MKRLSFILIRVFATLGLFLGTGYITYAEVNPKPFVVPELTSWTGAEGKFMPTGRVIVKGNKEVFRIATDFITEYKQLTGKNLSIAKGKAAPGDFIFELSEKTRTTGRRRLLFGNRKHCPSVCPNSERPVLGDKNDSPDIRTDYRKFHSKRNDHRRTRIQTARYGN